MTAYSASPEAVSGADSAGADDAPEEAGAGAAEEDGAEPTFELDLGVEQHGDAQGQGHAQGDGEDTEEDGVPGGLPEVAVLEHPDVVAQADKLVVAKAQVLTEAGVDGLDEGPQVQNHQT